MAKKKTPVLPSGNYNKKVYDYTDSSGKRIYRSFTSDDEDELNFMVAEFKLRKKKTKGHPERMTLNEAITKYISTSDAVLGAKTMSFPAMGTWIEIEKAVSLFLKDNPKFSEPSRGYRVTTGVPSGRSESSNTKHESINSMIREAFGR